MESSFLGLIVILVIIMVFAKKGNNSLNSPMDTLVLTNFQIMDSDSSDEIVYISGRQSGIIGWLLVKLGLGAETTIQVKKNELLMSSASLSGEFHSNMTLKNIASSHCGFYKPIHLLIFGVLLIIGGLFSMITSVGLGIFILILGGIMFAMYYFKKMIRIMVQTKGGGIFGMCFTPSLIEGINVDIEKAQAAVDLINKYMMIEQHK